MHIRSIMVSQQLRPARFIMNRKNLSLEAGARDNSDIRARFASQCDTFKHLGVADSIRYNWAKHYTHHQTDASARDVADHVNKLDTSILILMAESPTTSANTLDVLAFSSNPTIRQAVADNARTRKDTLLLLAEDEDPEVRYAMAENYNMEIDILVMLSEDDNPFVKVRACETLARVLSSQPAAIDG